MRQKNIDEQFRDKTQKLAEKLKASKRKIDQELGKDIESNIGKLLDFYKENRRDLTLSEFRKILGRE